MKDRVHVVVERSDGTRLARMPAARWMVSATVGVAGIGLAVLGAAWGDYAALAQQRARFAALEQRLEAQERLITEFQTRIAEVRTEVDSWRALHAQIWQPLGPGPARAGAATGVGGGTAIRLLGPPDTARDIRSELERLAAVVSQEGESLRALERFMSRAGQVLASLPLRWPVRGPVNSEFGRRESPWGSASAEFHSGLDIGAARGTVVTAPAPGTVLAAGPHAEYGVTLIIDHGNDIRTLYGHLSRVLVQRDQRVERGQVVAMTGNTGRSSGPHLHYEIQVKGQPVNPRTYIWD